MQPAMMTIGSNYPTPVTVNGFLCKNCTDVDFAKKHIDPAHPKSGPYGINAKDDPTIKNAPTPAVVFGGNLAASSRQPTGMVENSAAAPAGGAVANGDASYAAVGAQLDVSA